MTQAVVAGSIVVAALNALAALAGGWVWYRGDPRDPRTAGVFWVALRIGQGSALTLAIAVGSLAAAGKHPREGLFYRGKWLWMWPNWTLSLFAGGMNTSRINPLDHQRTELIYNFYFSDPSDHSAIEDTIARNLAVVREDFEICLETHKNYATGSYTAGPLSPRHEEGVRYFQDKVKESLAAA